MATVQTCTVELMPMPSEAPASPTNPLEAPQQSRRVFNVAPTATVGHSSRVLITTLLILANFVQVSWLSRLADLRLACPDFWLS